MNEYMIESDRLKVYFRIEDGMPSHTRFERMGVMEKIELDGRHTFCTKEQLNPKFRSSLGVGLIGEYVWDGLAEEAKKGEQFPKLGVGLLTQKKNHRKYYFIEKYEVEPYEMSYNISGNKAEFVIEPKECMGIAARLKKTVIVEGNVVTAHMSVENVGSRTIDAFEYQHNFVNIDDIKVGPGYRLELPFFGQMDSFYECVRENFKPIKPHFLIHILKYVMKTRWFKGFMKPEGQSVFWLKSMEGYNFWTFTDDINTEKGLYWRLSHEASEASAEEHFSFVPSKVINWGTEHCISTEAYAHIYAEPGNIFSWERKWIFND